MGVLLSTDELEGLLEALKQNSPGDQVMAWCELIVKTRY